MDGMKNVTLYEEYRMIERSEVAINRAWKGAHLLLFFLAFVFGSFCTFCFHMLMYLFDEKCVLFPKLLSLTSLRHNVIYEYIPSSRDLTNLPVDFLSTQWVEKSTCALPTYVPLVSGIFGLVWTTMFLMCSTGSRTLTGLQRPWRVLPPVFVFSLMMGGLCVYSSAITHYGLQELCVKLGEISGSSTCTYAVNVATLTYERRIRGVYQATRLTIVSAWLHTFCWLCSAMLAAARVLLGVDFQLVRISVELHGDVDRIMEQNEKQIRTIYPDNVWLSHENETVIRTVTASKASSEASAELTEIKQPDETLFDRSRQNSELSLVPEESYKLARLSAYERVPKDKRFIVKMLFDLIGHLHVPDSSLQDSTNVSEEVFEDESKEVVRQFGTSKVVSRNTLLKAYEDVTVTDTLDDGDNAAHYIRNIIMNRVNGWIDFIEVTSTGTEKEPHVRRKLQIMSAADVFELPDSSHQYMSTRDESNLHNTDEMIDILKFKADRTQSTVIAPDKIAKKRKNIDTQTEIVERRNPKPPPKKRKKEKALTVREDDDVSDNEQPDATSSDKVDKETQTKKEKQD